MSQQLFLVQNYSITLTFTKSLIVYTVLDSTKKLKNSLGEINCDYVPDNFGYHGIYNDSDVKLSGNNNMHILSSNRQRTNKIAKIIGDDYSDTILSISDSNDDTTHKNLYNKIKTKNINSLWYDQLESLMCSSLKSLENAIELENSSDNVIVIKDESELLTTNLSKNFISQARNRPQFKNASKRQFEILRESSDENANEIEISLDSSSIKIIEKHIE